MILIGQALVDTLRKRCDNAKNRIWITSPFIGGLKGVQCIIGGSWMQSSIDFKVITDIEAGFIRRDTYQEFVQYKCNIRSIKSLHAKIYIVDNWALITSANLTGTAFSRRHEIGTEITDITQFKDLTTEFERLSKISKKVTKTPIISSSTMTDYHDSSSFGKVCNLPAYNNQNRVNSKYFANVDIYKYFAKYYEYITGRKLHLCLSLLLQ